MKYWVKLLPPLAATLLLAPMVAPSFANVTELRLYVLDCGHAIFKDMAGFSDTGEYDGKPGEIAAPCFLIRHPKGDLLWDAGLGDHYATPKEGSDAAPGVHVTVPAHGRVIVQHDPIDFKSLPKPPAYLD